MTLNGVVADTLRYFPEFGKPAFQYITASICGVIYARVYIVFCIVYDVVAKKVHVRSPGEFLVLMVKKTYLDESPH